MPTLIINSQVIDFPASAASPDWAPAIIQFAEAVQDGLAISIGTFDVAPQTMTIDAYNAASNVNIPALAFPTDSVRSIFLRYDVYRTTDSEVAYEAGDLSAMYVPSNSTGFKWTLTQGNILGNGGKITFNMTDTGQIQFSTTALAGTGHAGKISFDGRALEQS